MRRLDAPIRGYAWGSRTAIARMQGRPPSDAPEAEMWIGAHPGSPAVLTDTGEGLDAAIAADPSRLLGESVVESFGARLPFLLKVLAAAEPLSLQAHPDAAQAAAGFAAEEAAGVALLSPSRVYVDASHKPELLVALESFDALCGFRPPAASAALLDALGVPALEPVVSALRHPDESTALRTAVESLLRHPLPGPLVAAAVSAASSAGEDYSLVVSLADHYPGDPGVVLALLLNRVRLAPDEGVWMPAGNLHAYLCGVGVEVMAASDNVLRGGLTPKHVAVDELLRILRFEVLVDPVVRPVEVAPHVQTWPVPVSDFALFRASVDGVRAELPGEGPRVALCVRGEVTVDDGSEPVRLRAGEAAFAAAGAKPLAVTGTGQLFQATVG
jgi:mannose-6-phosphate isomerase